VLSLIFMALTSGPGYAAETTRGVPVGMAIDTLFVFVFMAVVKRGLGRALLASLGTWAAAAFLFIRAIPPLGTAAAILLYLAVLALCFSVAEWGLCIRMAERRPSSFSWKHIAVRALFAGTVVAGAVTVAQFAPPYMTGILSTFPAVLSSTLVIFTLGQGPDFARATGKILILSSSNIIVYAGVAGATFAGLGPWIGSLLAFLASITYVSLLSPLIARIK